MRRIDEEKLNKTLQYIRDFQTTEGKSPNYRQIQKNCGFSSLATVHLYVDRLKERNLIDIETQGGWEKIHIPSCFSPDEDTQNSYIVGEVHCGPPTDAVEYIEACVKLPRTIFGSGEHVLLHAKGPSMVNRGIFDGDLLVVRRTPVAEYGQTIIALLENSESTCKVLDNDGNKVYLRAANDTIENGRRKYDIYPKGEWTIYGVVDYVIHAPIYDEL